jgi:hypothetical protein
MDEEFSSVDESVSVNTSHLKQEASECNQTNHICHTTIQLLDSFQSGMLELGCHSNVPEKRIKNVEQSSYQNDKLKVERKFELEKALNDPEYNFNPREKELL